MDILAVTYSNIGPFENSLITLNFKKGKYLIKAPIGSGKSFLFFDGVVYGLYKYSARNMLNRKSKEGFINIFFEIEGSMYAIQRLITPTKTGGESTQSRLWTVSCADTVNVLNNKLPEVLNKKINILDIISTDMDTSEIDFKSSTELQKTLEELLPPKEVFLSTNFLMQDSDNIFELTPADRITIFKNIFGLIGIDEAKDIIAENKKALTMEIKIKSDNSSFDTKIKSMIDSVYSSHASLRSNTLKIPNLDKFLDLGFWQDIALWGDKINIKDFDISNIDISLIDNVIGDINILKEQYNTNNIKLQNLKETYQKTNQEIENISRNNIQLQNEIDTINQNISSVDSASIQILKDHKSKLLNRQSELISEIDWQTIAKHGYPASDIFELTNTIDSLTSQGKTLKSELTNMDMQIANITEKKKNLENNIASYEEKIQSISTQLDQSNEFFCDKIDGHCPYVNMIKHDTNKVFQDQIKSLTDEKSTATTQLQALDFDNNIKSLESQKSEINQNIDQLKQFFNDFDWQKAKNIYDQYKTLDNEIRQTDVQIAEKENLANKIAEYQQKILTLQANISANSTSQDKLKLDLEQINSNIADTQILLDQIDMIQLKETETKLANIRLDFDKILTLVHEFKHNQLHIQKLTTDLKIIDDLYNIFSKEFMLVVLQDFLPVLSDVINNYLANVVDYQIKFELLKKSTDKLELEISAYDDKGARPIKSLSGGQKTILKLVWMLAISNLRKTDFLFLDETINNLDTESVGKVSALIQDFVKFRDMKFYVITHSEQIQSMQIWDGTIDLHSLNK